MEWTTLLIGLAAGFLPSLIITIINNRSSKNRLTLQLENDNEKLEKSLKHDNKLDNKNKLYEQYKILLDTLSYFSMVDETNKTKEEKHTHLLMHKKDIEDRYFIVMESLYIFRLFIDSKNEKINSLELQCRQSFLNFENEVFLMELHGLETEKLQRLIQENHHVWQSIRNEIAQQLSKNII